MTPVLNVKKSKAKDSVSYLTEVLDQIKCHMLNGWKINQVLLIIGSTPMSPRESYTIDVSCLENSDQSDNDKGKCLRKIMQSLFIDSFLNNLPAALPLSNCYFFIQVDRQCVEENPSSFFEPRLRFYLTGRGLKFNLRLSNSNVTETEGEKIYMAPSKPFRGVKTFTGNTPCAKQDTKPRDFLDTIRA